MGRISAVHAFGSSLVRFETHFNLFWQGFMICCFALVIFFSSIRRKYLDGVRPLARRMFSLISIWYDGPSRSYPGQHLYCRRWPLGRTERSAFWSRNFPRWYVAPSPHGRLFFPAHFFRVKPSRSVLQFILSFNHFLKMHEKICRSNWELRMNKIKKPCKILAIEKSNGKTARLSQDSFCFWDQCERLLS